jgi:hypothetical protein
MWRQGAPDCSQPGKRTHGPLQSQGAATRCGKKSDPMKSSGSDRRERGMPAMAMKYLRCEQFCTAQWRLIAFYQLRLADVATISSGRTPGHTPRLTYPLCPWVHHSHHLDPVLPLTTRWNRDFFAVRPPGGFNHFLRGHFSLDPLGTPTPCSAATFRMPAPAATAGAWRPGRAGSATGPGSLALECGGTQARASCPGPQTASSPKMGYTGAAAHVTFLPSRLWSRQAPCHQRTSGVSKAAPNKKAKINRATTIPNVRSDDLCGIAGPSQKGCPPRRWSTGKPTAV